MACVVKIILGLGIGVAGGYGLSRLLCIGGGCPLTSNRPLMMAMGALAGVWIGVAGCSRKASSQTAHFGNALTTVEQFQAEVIDAGKPALVDFYADWCGPCRRIAPVLAELEKQYEGKVAFFRVDVDQAKALAEQHNVRSIPTLMLYSGGKQVESMVGAPSKADLVAKLDRLAAPS